MLQQCNSHAIRKLQWHVWLAFGSTYESESSGWGWGPQQRIGRKLAMGGTLCQQPSPSSCTLGTDNTTFILTLARKSPLISSKWLLYLPMGLDSLWDKLGERLCVQTQLVVAVQTKLRLCVSSKSKALLTAMEKVLWLRGVSWIHGDEHGIPHREIQHIPLGRAQFPKHGFLGMFCGMCSAAALEEKGLINLMSYPPTARGCAGYPKTSQMALGACI